MIWQQPTKLNNSSLFGRQARLKLPIDRRHHFHGRQHQTEFMIRLFQSEKTYASCLSDVRHARLTFSIDKRPSFSGANLQILRSKWSNPMESNRFYWSNPLLQIPGRSMVVNDMQTREIEQREDSNSVRFNNTRHSTQFTLGMQLKDYLCDLAWPFQRLCPLERSNDRDWAIDLNSIDCDWAIRSISAILFAMCSSYSSLCILRLLWKSDSGLI